MVWTEFAALGRGVVSTFAIALAVDHSFSSSSAGSALIGIFVSDLALRTIALLSVEDLTVGAGGNHQADVVLRIVALVALAGLNS